VSLRTRITLVAVAVVAFIAVIVGGVAGIKGFSRYQAMSDAKNQAQIALVKAHNNVQVTEIEIQNQNQRIQVTKQQAQIRYQEAVGLREAQDEVAKTLTPLYVQFEYAKALEEIAKSGKNNSVVYIPTGNGGVPLVSGVAGQPQTTPSK
jgi:ribosomal protein S1